MIRYCKACKHAEFAHNGLAHDDCPTGCDLCVCKKFEHD